MSMSGYEYGDLVAMDVMPFSSCVFSFSYRFVFCLFSLGFSVLFAVFDFTYMDCFNGFYSLLALVSLNALLYHYSIAFCVHAITHFKDVLICLHRLHVFKM